MTQVKAITSHKFEHTIVFPGAASLLNEQSARIGYFLIYDGSTLHSRSMIAVNTVDTTYFGVLLDYDQSNPTPYRGPILYTPTFDLTVARDETIDYPLRVEYYVVEK